MHAHHSQSPTMRGSSSMATTRFAFSSSFMVRFPVPGPISSTTSVDFTLNYREIIPCDHRELMPEGVCHDGHAWRSLGQSLTPTYPLLPVPPSGS